MKHIFFSILALISIAAFAQDKEAVEAQAKLSAKISNTFVYEANKLIDEDDFVSAEMVYREALSEQPSNAVGAYNLGSLYIKQGDTGAALYRLQEATKAATSKAEKHKAFHNIGNVLMGNKKCQEAVEAYKNALRNDPTDEETRYNLGLAKICAEQQKDNQDQNQDNQDQNQDQNQDNQDQNQDNKDNQDQNDQNKDQQDKGDNQDENKDNQDQSDQDKQEGDDEKDEDGKPKDQNQDQGDEKEQPQQPKPQQGQLSPQQIKNLLEAMNNQEQKVQEKMNAEQQKGIKVKTEKDW